MNAKELKNELNDKRIRKPEIVRLVTEITSKPDLVNTLLEEMFLADAKGNNFNASWLLDHVLRKELALIYPYLNLFCKSISSLKNESNLRPVAHIIEMLVLQYYVKRDKNLITILKKIQLEQLTTTCFDWLIGDHKIATQVFCTTALYHLGTTFNWVHPELIGILENKMDKGSTGFKNRAEKTLNLLYK
ncbi:hypothetical protein [Croceivirga radicis]|uniref:hypothetical protein n=1 Tax=Croceivirga radicis TaxID=1929488 RepID=UPI000255AAFB|nr:hypothetical protein [Croceivirga radicis]